MKSPLLYLLEVLFCSGLLLALYHLLLVRRIPFVWCRRYLLAALLLSALLPALEIPVYPARTAAVQPSAAAGRPAETAEAAAAAEPAAALPAAAFAPARERLPELRRGLQLLYLLTTAALAGLLTLRVRAIRRLRRRARLTRCKGYTLAEHPSVETPFTFLRTIFLGDGYEGRRREIVLLHEASHVRHRHSAERILLEIIRCLFWFNPFVWIAERWLAELHEWEADRDVLDAGCGLTEYRTLLFCQLFGYNPDIVCGLKHSFTKKRFTMMTRLPKRRFAAWRLGATLPFVAGMTMLCSFTVRDAAAEPEELPATAGANDLPQPAIHLSADGTRYLNGERMSLDELMERLERLRAELSDEEAARTVVRLSADGEMPLQYLINMRTALQRAKWLRVEYCDEQQQPVSTLLPPAPQQATGSVQIVWPAPEQGGAADEAGSVPVKHRNLLKVLVSQRGNALVGISNTKGKIAAAEELPARIRTFVLEESEQESTVFTLSDGSAVQWPVSQGVVSLMAVGALPYAKYVEVVRRVEQGFLEARAARAEQLTGRPYEQLDEAEQELFRRVVPIKVFEPEQRTY